MARPQTWPNVGPTLVGLTVADLPVIFWCRHKGALSQAATKDDHAGLEAITSLATKIVIDTRDMPTAEAITLMERWQARGRVVADLEWTRLTPWREPLAHVFDVCECKLVRFPLRRDRAHGRAARHGGALPGRLAFFVSCESCFPPRPRLPARRPSRYVAFRFKNYRFRANRTRFSRSA